MSGKIITRVRARQRQVQDRLQHGKIVWYPTEVDLDRPRDPPVGRIYEAETPGAYAADPISRFFRWVFRL